MLFREAARLALGTLWANRLRSFLTVLGNVVAVLSVVALVSVIQGLNRYVSTEILSTGSGSFQITKFGIIMNYEDYLNALKRPDLTVADAADLERKMTTAAAVVPSLRTSLAAKRGRLEAEDVPVLGLGAGYPLLGRAVLASGRDLGPEDMRQKAAVAVIGDRLREKLFGSEDPLGKDLRIGGQRVTVVGVRERRGGTASGTADDQVIIPVTTLAKFVGLRNRSVDIEVLASSPELLEEAQDEASTILKIRRGLQPWDKADFDTITDEQLYGFYEKISQGIYGLLLGVVSLSLLVGGIVIMNIMLVSVSERTREIGIRKAVGARRKDIVAQFLAESVTLAFSGGVVGVLGGIGAALAVRAWTPLPASVQLWSVLVGLALASSVGLFFGIYPAWRASRLEPIVALRYEN